MARKNVIVVVSVAAAIFLVVDAGLGLWSASEIRVQVGSQFNEEQLVIARNVAGLIEREITFLKKELLLLSQDISQGPFNPDKQYETIQKTLSRVLESGVWKIEIIDLKNKKTYINMPYKHWATMEISETRWDPSVLLKVSNARDVVVFQPQDEPPRTGLLLGTSLSGDTQKFLFFDVNVSWFLTPFLKDIRSGKTGYAWLIDENGFFLFHPNTDFIGKSAFEVREEVHPYISYGIINSIQKEKMLKGQEGTSWYISFWHRGITGQIKKYIAYCPIVISSEPPQKWSVAVVAPVFEIEQAVKSGYIRQILLHGLVIVVIVLAASAIVIFEIRWSRVLEEKVNQRTEELKKSEDKYRSLVESAEDFIFTLNSEGRFQSMNSFTANFFGGRPEEFLGKDLSTLFPPAVVEKQIKLVQQVYKLGKSVRDEFELKIGENEIWINANFMPLKDQEGNVSSVLCIARDITENKSLERKLVNTEKLASLGTLAAGVAHEINNPLGIMLGFCDLLVRKKEKGTQEYEDLKTIEKHGLHCKQVVENLLSVARIGEGISEYSDLNICLNEIIEVVKHTLDMNDVELIMELDDNIPLVKGDPRELQQVFLNLINNASAAMKDGGTLKICTRLDKNTRKAVVQFQDNGVGIRKEDMDHIFEPFFTTRPAGEGTGLGLFISYGIMTKYGGSIDCVSTHSDSPNEPGGTSFTLNLLTKMREG